MRINPKYLALIILVVSSVLVGCKQERTPQRTILVDTITVTSMKIDTGLVSIKALRIKSIAESVIHIDKIELQGGAVATQSSIIELYDQIQAEMPQDFRIALNEKNNKASQSFESARRKGVVLFVDTISKEVMTRSEAQGRVFVDFSDISKFLYSYRKLSLRISTPITFSLAPGEERAIAIDEFRPAISVANIQGSIASIAKITCTPLCSQSHLGNAAQ